MPAQLPAVAPQVSGVVESTSATLPAVADIAIAPLASNAGSGGSIVLAPIASCTR